jgi:Xaa-Pro dipeptidase
VDHALRRRRLADRLGEIGLDAVLVTRLPNVRYLTGSTGSNGQVVLGREGTVLLSDGRYEEQAAREAPDVARRTYLEDQPVHLLRACADLGARVVGFEREGVTYGTWQRLRDAADGIDLVPVAGEVERLRRAKDAEEVALIERAQETADVAFEEVVLGGLRGGTTERELAFALELAMRRAGADALGFDVIAAFGANASEPHHDPTDRELRRGDVIKLDFGALVEGYHSDMTRTVAFGEPGPRLREVRDVVAAAQAAGIEATRAQASVREVDAAARRVIEAADLGERFPHGLGHGVGLEIHEGPFLRWDLDEEICEGAVVTIEPGVYLPGVGGVRIEDMVEVTIDGARVLPRSTREFVVL